jgi:hypothetical protein
MRGGTPKICRRKSGPTHIYNRNVEPPHTLFHLLMVRLNLELPRLFEVRFSIGDCFGGVDRDSVLERRMPAMDGAPPRDQKKPVRLVRNGRLEMGRRTRRRTPYYRVRAPSRWRLSESEKRVGDCGDGAHESRDDL